MLGVSPNVNPKCDCFFALQWNVGLSGTKKILFYCFFQVVIRKGAWLIESTSMHLIHCYLKGV